MKREVVLLRFGMAVPLIYFGTLLILPLLLYPGYDHRTQYVSELGAATAPHPLPFNFLVIACGMSAMLGAVGIAQALRRLYTSRVAAALTGVTLFLWGAAIVTAGLFPMPNELHGAFGLAMVLHVAPLFALAAVWRAERIAWMRWLLVTAFLVSGALFAIMMGVGSLVRVADVGYWQRAYALSSLAWIGVLAWALHAGLRAASPASA